MTVPYRADQVGSFLRPAALLEARKDPSTPPERIRELEDRAILDCLARQRELGYEIFTDGELRRRSWHMARSRASTRVPISSRRTPPARR